MGATPTDRPVAVPVLDPIVATPVAPDVHVPPPAQLSVVLAPWQILMLPVTAPGNGFTVTTVVALQPVANV